MRYEVCNWIFGDEDLATTTAFRAEAAFDGVELKRLFLFPPADSRADPPEAQFMAC
jgi:hypothetical protein